MILPNMVNADRIQKKVQDVFKGYEHRTGAGDGALWDMTNLSARGYPLLTPRERRATVTTLTKPNGLFARERLCWVDGTGFYYDGALKGKVTDSRKVFAALGSVIVILPDKVCYDSAGDLFGALESRASAASAEFRNGTIYGKTAAANTLHCAAVSWAEHFSAGDGVTISGCTVHPENNKTTIIREISGNELRFSENCFQLGSGTGYTEGGAVTVTRAVPDMDFLCANENRLWGCKGDTVYASKLGDVKNFNVFDGVETDAWACDVGGPGDFTGMCAFLGYPVAFKENGVYKIYGDRPSNYQVMGSARAGVQKGSGASLAVAGETLFYLGTNGPMAYTGGMPRSLAEPFGEECYINGVAGSDGRRYYISMEDDIGAHPLFCYDTQQGLWHREDDVGAVALARAEDGLYLLRNNGALLLLSGTAPAGSLPEGAVAWSAEFGDFHDGSSNKKGVVKLQIRAELEDGAGLSVFVQYNSDGKWVSVSSVAGTRKRSWYLPLRLKRCDHYRLRLTGTGNCKIYSISREMVSDSAL